VGLQAPVQVLGGAEVVLGEVDRPAQGPVQVNQVGDRGGHHSTAPNISSTIDLVQAPVGLSLGDGLQLVVVHGLGLAAGAGARHAVRVGQGQDHALTRGRAGPEVAAKVTRRRGGDGRRLDLHGDHSSVPAPGGCRRAGALMLT
jgi:hypothetical protein